MEIWFASSCSILKHTPMMKFRTFEKLILHLIWIFFIISSKLDNNFKFLQKDPNFHNLQKTLVISSLKNKSLFKKKNCPKILLFQKHQKNSLEMNHRARPPLLYRTLKIIIYSSSLNKMIPNHSSNTFNPPSSSNKIKQQGVINQSLIKI